MKNGIAKFLNETEKKDFIKKEDAAFSKRLDAALSGLISDPEIRVILLSGPSGSGKTTASERIAAKFAAVGRHIQFVSVDDFYLDRDEIARRASRENREVEYESVKAIDLDALSRFAADVKEKKQTSVPRFSFSEGKKVGERPVDCSAGEVVLIEGIQALYPEIKALFADIKHIELFIRPLDELQVANALFDGNELRLFRRIVRNSLQRGSSADLEFDMWNTVRDNEEKNIFPSIKEGVNIIDSMLAYEPNVIKPLLMRSLEAVEKKSPYYEYARDIIRRFDGIEEIDRSYLPIDSLFCEFVF